MRVCVGMLVCVWEINIMVVWVLIDAQPSLAALINTWALGGRLREPAGKCKGGIRRKMQFHQVRTWNSFSFICVFIYNTFHKVSCSKWNALTGMSRTLEPTGCGVKTETVSKTTF